MLSKTCGQVTKILDPDETATYSPYHPDQKVEKGNITENVNCTHNCYLYCAFHVLVQPNFRRYFYFLPDQAQTHLNHLKVLDEL